MKPAQTATSLIRTLQMVRLALPVALITLSVAVGVPLFVRSPLWCDVTLYDLAARNVLAGGVHYRDLFDTNTPGFVWLLSGLRSVIGWGSESVLVVDLLIALGTTLTLCRLAKLAGASAVNRLWLIAGCAGFYLFTHEMTHAQRDVWLSLPALTAVMLRLQRITRPTHGTFRGVFLPAMVEGALWAVAVWIKPHFLLVAVCWWLLTLTRLAGARTVGQRWWAWAGVLAADLGGTLLSGGLIGAVGVWYLVASGTWAAFTEVMTVWNVGYLEFTLSQMHARWGFFAWFPPWNFLAPFAVAYSLFGVIDARMWAGRFRTAERGGLLHRIAFRWVWFTAGTDEQRYARACLGAVYILWLLQGIILQRAYMYVHVTEVMIGLAVWAGFRWNATALIFGWLLVVQACWVIDPQAMGDAATVNPNVREVFTPHPLFDRRRIARWPDCFRQSNGGEQYELYDDLRREVIHPASFNWVELGEVADYLRGRKVGDEELVCWHDSPHPIYLMLDVKPGLRFMHVNTATMISPDCHRRVCEEYQDNTHKRFVVIDLQRLAFAEWVNLCLRSPDPLGDDLRDDIYRAYNQPGPTADDLLPPAAAWTRTNPQHLHPEPAMPFDTTRTVFRSGGGRGRYVVIQLKE